MLADVNIDNIINNINIASKRVTRNELPDEGDINIINNIINIHICWSVQHMKWGWG